MSRFDRGPIRDANEPRVNERIRKSPVRLIDNDGGQLGIVALEEARRLAEERGLDLVEVGATADPPVVRILDWGKVRYEKQKKERESKKKAAVIEVKEIKYRPTIDGHDFGIKTSQARRFLGKGNKVKVTVFFRFRQLRRPELGNDILDKVTQQLADVAVVEHRSRMEGRQMVMVLAPLGMAAHKEATPHREAPAKELAPPKPAAPTQEAAPAHQEEPAAEVEKKAEAESKEVAEA